MKRNIYSHLFLVTVATIAVFGVACTVTTSTNTTRPESSANTSNASATPASSPTSSTTAPATVKDISGGYDATGTNAGGGTNYKAGLVITKRDDVYQFSWTSGSNSYDGVGVMTDNSVAVSFTEGADGKGCGVALYKIGADGSLDGKSGYWGVNQGESEKAVRTSGTDLDGKYNITGKATGGKDYKGTLDVKKDGEGYAFLWNTDSTLEGFGIKVGDRAAVGFGGKACSFVYYDVKSDGTLEGKWGGAGSKTFGTETAKKK